MSSVVVKAEEKQAGLLGTISAKLLFNMSFCAVALLIIAVRLNSAGNHVSEVLARQSSV